MEMCLLMFGYSISNPLSFSDKPFAYDGAFFDSLLFDLSKCYLIYLPSLFSLTSVPYLFSRDFLDFISFFEHCTFLNSMPNLNSKPFGAGICSLFEVFTSVSEFHIKFKLLYEHNNPSENLRPFRLPKSFTM